MVYFPTISEECPEGFTKNEHSGRCEDIDECESTEVTCNIDTQVCYNTEGSYRCLDIQPAPTQKSCPNGYEFDLRIKQCVGKQISFYIFQLLYLMVFV